MISSMNLWIGSAALHCSCIIHVLFFVQTQYVFLTFFNCKYAHILYIYIAYTVCVCAPVWACAPTAYVQMWLRDGWRLSRGVWASSSGHLITALAPAACLCLPRPPCLGASFLAESDDALPLSPKCYSLEGPTLVQIMAVVWLADLN